MNIRIIFNVIILDDLFPRYGHLLRGTACAAFYRQLANGSPIHLS